MPKAPRTKPDAAAGLKVELRAVADLKPYPRNAKKHPEAQIREIMASIRQFGWTNPILADDFIRAGHGRCVAAMRIYAAGESIRLPNGAVLPTGTVPVIDCSGWSATQRQAYVLADNKIAENAEWDAELLGLEIGEIKKAGDFELSGLGFSAKEIEKALAGPKQPETGAQLGEGMQFQVIVSCTDEDHQRELLTRFEGEGLTCKALIA